MAHRSRNFDEFPAFGGVMYVAMCMMFNIFAVFMLLDGLGWFNVSFEKEYKFPFTFGLILIILFYYLYKKRYKKIIAKYEQQERSRDIRLHPLVVFFIYYGISFGILLLAGLYKNGDWIFAN
jgi:hypothetical protein